MPYTADVKDIVYQYDGTFPGFLCCIFESYRRRELPAAVLGPTEQQLMLFPAWAIETRQDQAQRVYRALGRFGAVAKVRIMTGFLNGDPGKDLTLLRFARLCVEHGPAAAQMLGDPDCAAAFALERAVNNDACFCREFLRFEQRGDMLGAVLHPKHCVLPLLRAHFCSRLPDEKFLIFDATHGAALIRCGDQVEYREMDRYTPAADDAELNWQSLWKGFFRATDIPERRNEAAQLNHCRKRYWGDMVEMRDRL